MKFDYKKSLGQNFLKDKNIIKKIADSINPTEEDLIIEIGPGAGALTKELVKKKSEVICFEIDTRLKEILEQINSEKLTIIFKDFLSIKINEYIDGCLYYCSKIDYIHIIGFITQVIKKELPYIIKSEEEYRQEFISAKISDLVDIFKKLNIFIW